MYACACVPICVPTFVPGLAVVTLARLSFCLAGPLPVCPCLAKPPTHQGGGPTSLSVTSLSV